VGNGPVEGQINRLKMLKRQMYGRAKIDVEPAILLAALKGEWYELAVVDVSLPSHTARVLYRSSR